MCHVKHGERKKFLLRVSEKDISYPTVIQTHSEQDAMRLPDTKPTRKQTFEAALKLAGLTVEDWRTNVYRVSAQHLSEVWKYDIDPRMGRKPSAELNAAIDRVIAKYLPDRTAA